MIGNDIQLTCQSQEGSPAPQYSWRSYDQRNQERTGPAGTGRREAGPTSRTAKGDPGLTVRSPEGLPVPPLLWHWDISDLLSKQHCLVITPTSQVVVGNGRDSCHVLSGSPQWKTHVFFTPRNSVPLNECVWVTTLCESTEGILVWL